MLHQHAEAAGRNPKEIEVAPQFSLLIGKTQEAAEKAYMQSGLVAHRVSLAHTGRDPVHQVTANLVGSPQSDHRKNSSAQSNGRRSLRSDGGGGQYPGRAA